MPAYELSVWGIGQDFQSVLRNALGCVCCNREFQHCVPVATTRSLLQYGSISQMLRACAYGTPGIVSDIFNISEVFQCHKSACQGLMSS